MLQSSDRYKSFLLGNSLIIGEIYTSLERGVLGMRNWARWTKSPPPLVSWERLGPCTWGPAYSPSPWTRGFLSIEKDHEFADGACVLFHDSVALTWAWGDKVQNSNIWFKSKPLFTRYSSSPKRYVQESLLWWFFWVQVQGQRWSPLYPQAVANSSDCQKLLNELKVNQW